MGVYRDTGRMQFELNGKPLVQQKVIDESGSYSTHELLLVVQQIRLEAANLAVCKYVCQICVSLSI